jgi:hypothetical protein
MGLLGGGVVLVWCDIAAEAADEHERWHSYEHIPERLAVPGYLRVRRGISQEPDVPRIFVLYEVRDLDVVTSPAYLERLNNPSAWTSRMMRSVKRLNRTPCRIAGSAGAGIGAQMATIRLTPDPAAESRLRHWLASTALPEIARQPGIVGAHLLEADAVARGPNTREQVLRGQRDEAANWVIVLEGFDRQAVREVPAALLSAEQLSRHGARLDGPAAAYQLVHIASAADVEAASGSKPEQRQSA